MNQISLPKASQLTSPNPLTLVCTLSSEGQANLATVSWWTYLSFRPGTIGFAMSKKSFSGEVVRETKRVILATPGSGLAEAVMKCGSTSGRDHHKAEEFGIELRFLPDTDIPVPVHTRCAFVCSLAEVVEVGDHYLYICNVDSVYGNEEEKALFAFKGYGEVRTAD